MESPAEYERTPPPGSPPPGFTQLTLEQVEAARRRTYDYAAPDAGPDRSPPVLRPLRPEEHRANTELLQKNRLLREAVERLSTRTWKAERVLGELYAHIFGDGGHKQAELDGQTVEVPDWLDGNAEGTVSGHFVPALPHAALAVLHELRARAEQAEARVKALEAAAGTAAGTAAAQSTTKKESL